MKRVINILVVALVMAAMMAVMAAPAFAINEGPGRGNPDTTDGNGSCPPGQNKDTSVGGLKKCP